MKKLLEIIKDPRYKEASFEKRKYIINDWYNNVRKDSRWTPEIDNQIKADIEKHAYPTFQAPPSIFEKGKRLFGKAKEKAGEITEQIGGVTKELGKFDLGQKISKVTSQLGKLDLGQRLADIYHKIDEKAIEEGVRDEERVKTEGFSAGEKALLSMHPLGAFIQAGQKLTQKKHKPLSEEEIQAEINRRSEEQRIQEERGASFGLNAFRSLSFGLMPKSKWEENVTEKHPVFAQIGEHAGNLGAIIVTGAAIHPIVAPTAAKLGLSASRYLPSLHRFIPSMISSGATLGTYGTINEAARQAKDGKFDPVRLGKATLQDTAFGLAWGTAGAMATWPRRVLGAAGIGFVSAKLSGSSNTEALLNAGVFAAAEGIMGAGRNKALKKQSIKGLEDTLTKAYMLKTGTPEAEARILTRRFLSTEAQKAGGWEKILNSPSDKVLKRVEIIISKIQQGIKAGKYKPTPEAPPAPKEITGTKGQARPKGKPEPEPKAPAPADDVSIMKKEAELLRESGLSEDQIGKYVNDKIADGEKLRLYTTDVIEGKLTKEEAIKKIQKDFKSGKKEKPKLYGTVDDFMEKTPMDFQQEWGEIYERHEDRLNAFNEELKELQEEFKNTPARSKEKKEIKEQIDRVKETMAEINSEFQEWQYDENVEMRDAIQAKLEKEGMDLEEEEWVYFFDDYMTRLTERPYIEHNYEMTAKQILDDTIAEYKEDHPEWFVKKKDIKEKPTKASKERKKQEFEVYTEEGSPIKVTYEEDYAAGAASHFEFHGEAVSSTGYRSHFINIGKVDNPEKVAQDLALAFHEEGKRGLKLPKGAKYVIKKEGGKFYIRSDKDRWTSVGSISGYGTEEEAREALSKFVKAGMISIENTELTKEKPAEKPTREPPTREKPKVVVKKAALVPTKSGYEAIPKGVISEKQQNPLGKTVVDIIKSEGGDLADTNLYIKKKVEGYEDLYVERISDNEIAMAHTYIQNGDVMLDPEIVFEIKDGQLIPKTFEQSSPPTGQRPIKPNDAFIKQWAKNLEVQGFTETTKKVEKAPEEIKPTEEKTRIAKLADEFYKQLRSDAENVPTDPKKLREFAKEIVGGDPKEYYDEIYDALEVALNKYAKDCEIMERETKAQLEMSQGIENKLPLRARSLETIKRQQFSTPLTLATAANNALDVQGSDIVLEPTAGTGNLIIPFEHKGATVKVNEIDDRRVEALKSAGLTPTQEDFLKYQGEATAIIANPPFGALQRGKYLKFAADFKATNIDQRFINKMLRIMPDGGRISVIVSEGTGYGVSGQSFRKWLEKEHTLIASIKSPDGAYKRRGSPTINTALMVIEKGRGRGTVEPKIYRPTTWEGYAGILENIKKNYPRLKIEEKNVIKKTEGGKSETQYPATQRGRTLPERTPARSGEVSTEGRAPRDIGRTPSESGKRPADVRERKQPRDSEPIQRTPEQRVKPERAGEYEPRAKDRKRYGSFIRYQRRNTLPARSPHPSVIVEAEELSTVNPPEIIYQPSPIVEKAHKQGHLSDEQADTVLLAMQSIEKGKGFVIADDVGVGKTREMAGIVSELLESGKSKRVLYITKNKQVLSDHLAKDFSVVMTGKFNQQLPYKVVNLAEMANLSKQDIPLYNEPSIYVVTWTKASKDVEVMERLSADALVVDEAHLWRPNDEKQQKAISWDRLHKALEGKPKVYATATPGTDLGELEYLYGLGVWNKGTFDNFIHSITGKEMQKRGMFSSSSVYSSAASIPLTQQVMREFKMRGLYLSRDLARHNVTFENLQLEFTPDDKIHYDTYYGFLRKVYDVCLKYAKFNKAKSTKGLVKSMIQSAAKRKLVDLKIERALSHIEKDIQDGKRVMLFTSGLNEIKEGLQKGYLKGAIDGINEHQVEKVEGEIYSEEIPEAIEEKAKLLDEMAGFPEQLSIENFVEERLGKKHKVVYYTGNTTEARKRKAIGEWARGNADMFVGSDAAKTAISAHDVIGRQIVVYYLDIDFSVTNFKQALGRANRAGEKTSPIFKVLSIGSGGEQKFVSTVASRMKNLGATSKGQAESGVVDFLSEYDLEGTVAHIAARNVYNNLSDREKMYFLNDKLFSTGFEGERAPRRFAPESYYIDNFMYDLNFMPFDISKEMFDKLIESYKGQLEQMAERLQLKAEKAKGETIREIELFRNSEDINDYVFMHEVVDHTGKRFGVLTGMLTDKMKTLRKFNVSRYIKFDTGGGILSGLKVLPSYMPDLAKEFGKSVASSITKDNAYDVIMAGDKVPAGADYELYKRQDGKIGIKGAKMKDKGILQQAGAKYSPVGNAWLLDPSKEAVDAFLKSFPLRQAVSKEEAARAHLEADEPEYNAPSIGLSVEFVKGSKTAIPELSGDSVLDSLLTPLRKIHDYIFTFGKVKRLDPALFDKFVSAYNSLSARVENAIIETKKIVGKSFTSTDRAEIAFGAEEKSYQVPKHLEAVTERARQIIDDLEQELKDAEVFKQGFIERKTAELENQRIAYESKIEELTDFYNEMGDKRGVLNRLEKYREKLDKTLESLEQIKDLNYITHRPVARAVLEKKMQQMGRRGKERYLANVRRLSYKYKHRAGITPLRILYQNGLLKKEDVDIFSLLSQIISEASFRLTMKGLFEYFKEQEYLLHKNKKDIDRAIFQRYNPLGSGIVANEYKDFWIHNLAMEGLTEIKRGLDKSGNFLSAIFAVIKSGQFYKPTIIWKYDFLQAAYGGAWGIKTPYYLAKAFKEVLVEGNDFVAANDTGLFQQAYLPVVGGKSESEMIKAAARQTLKDMPIVTKLLEKLLNITLTKDNTSALLLAPYRALAGFTWTGDRIIRLASWYHYKGMEYSTKDASRIAGHAHGAYMDISPRARKHMSFIFFVHSFRILMPRFLWRVIYEPTKMTYQKIFKGKTYPKRDWIRVAKGLAAAIIIPTLYHWYLRRKGFETEVPLWKYSKEYDDYEVVVGINSIISQPIKWISRLLKYNPLKEEPRIIQGLKSWGHWEMHPIYRILLDINRNRRSIGFGEIYDPNVTEEEKLLQSTAYLFRESFRLIPVLFPETEVDEGYSLTAEDRKKILNESLDGVTKFFSGTFGYSYVRKNKEFWKEKNLYLLNREFKKRMRYSQTEEEKMQIELWRDRVEKIIEKRYGE